MDRKAPGHGIQRTGRSSRKAVPGPHKFFSTFLSKLVRIGAKGLREWRQ